MRSLAYHPAAHAELEAEISYREGERKDAGRHLRSDIDASLAIALRFPEIGRMGLNGVRRLVTRHYHFIIHYDFSEEQIVIWAIVHPSREPGYWLSRRPT